METLSGRLEVILQRAEDRASGAGSTLERRLALEVSRLGCDLRTDLLELRGALDDDVAALEQLRQAVTEEVSDREVRTGPRPVSLRSPAVERFAMGWRELQSLARVLEAAGEVPGEVADA